MCNKFENSKKLFQQTLSLFSLFSKNVDIIFLFPTSFRSTAHEAACLKPTLIIQRFKICTSPSIYRSCQSFKHFQKEENSRRHTFFKWRKNYFLYKYIRLYSFFWNQYFYCLQVNFRCKRRRKNPNSILHSQKKLVLRKRKVILENE